MIRLEVSITLRVDSAFLERQYQEDSGALLESLVRQRLERVETLALKIEQTFIRRLTPAEAVEDTVPSGASP